MNEQLELDLGGRESRAKRLLRAVSPSSRLWGRLAGRTLAWAPVWLPGLLFVQITLVGLRPALAERDRLDAAEAVVADREASLAAEATTLARQQRMLGDPVYRERVRKSLTIPGAAPLLLEPRARLLPERGE